MKAFYYTSYITLVLALGLLLVVFYWLFFPTKPAEFFNLPFPITNENKVIKRGDCLHYEIDYCKYTDIMPDLRRFFVDGFIFETPDSVGVATKGCRKDIASIYIPENMMPGKYYIKTIARYQVNPLRTIDIINYTEEFEIK